MSFCTYIASDMPLTQSELLWPLSRASEDIYTEKAFTAQIAPDCEDLSAAVAYIQNHMETADELEIWHIWQGVESEPVIRSQTVPVGELTAEHILELQSRDVFNEHDDLAEVYTHNTDLKKRLLTYAKEYPELCQLTEDDEQGGLRFEMNKHRIGIRLTAPYSSDRRAAASQRAKQYGHAINSQFCNSPGT